MMKTKGRIGRFCCC